MAIAQLQRNPTHCPLEKTAESVISIKLKNFVYHHFLTKRNKTMDWRVLIVLAPLGVAATWALFNIGAAALNQVRNMQAKK